MTRHRWLPKKAPALSPRARRVIRNLVGVALIAAVLAFLWWAANNLELGY